MYSNYFVTAFRNIYRHKIFSIIVVLGLTIGVAVFGLIFQYVRHELSYDKFNRNYEETYRLESPDWALTGTAYGPEIAQQFPEVISSARVSCWEGSGATIKSGDDLKKLDNLVYADSGFFRIFSFSFVKGNPEHALDDPNSIILTESSAKKLFGNEDPMNKSFLVNNKLMMTVSGVIRDVDRFHLKISAVAPFVALKAFHDNEDFLTTYSSWNYYTYFYLKDHSDPVLLAGKINKFYKGHPNFGEEGARFSLRPLKEIYFTHIKNDFPQTKANHAMLRLYMIIALFILAIACVNFVNLTIALSATRSREIGVRKVMGARRTNLVTQFLGESVIYALIATEFSLVLMDLLRPLFNNLVQRQLALSSVSWMWVLLLILALPLLIGLVAGIYPALYLTRFKPMITLKCEKTRGRGSRFFRQALIVGQFTISIVLIIATLTVHKQLVFLQNADLGFSNENIINISLNSSLMKNPETFKGMLLNNPDIKKVSLSTQSMENVTWQEGMDVGNENKQYTYLGIDAEFIPLMGMKILEGKNFTENSRTDSGKVIINEEAVRYFGLKPPVTGQIIGTGERRFEILGVVKDFHYNSLRNPIGPLIMSLQNKWLSTANISVDSRHLPGAVSHIQKTWNFLSPDFLFDYRFLDKSYEQLYKDEQRLSKLFLYLAILAIFIASIGLLGLSSFLAEQRIKEIGIRKATGDTTNGIIMMFTKEFVKWVLLSGIIAVPIAWYSMNSWLKGFAYHVSLDIWIFMVSCMIATVIAMGTTIMQTFRIASRNPVEALRYE
jgi:putative ABC transport system permease protein